MSNICKECEDPSWTGQDPIVAPELPSEGGGGTSDFNKMVNRPKYDGQVMTSSTNIPNLSGEISSIQELIPAAATEENQLADKLFVNSSVATNTANFVGTFTSIEDLEAVQNPSNNDYGFVISTDASGNTIYNRYKYNSSTSAWVFEYALNNSSFTSAQWAAIQSGITTALVEKLSGLSEIKSIGNNLNLGADGTLSATDTTYSEFVGTDGQAAGTAGLVPAPTTTDVDKFLKGDGTWATAGGGSSETIRRLTQNDFNWNKNTGTTVNPNSVALWLLDTGWYYIAREDSPLSGQPANVPVMMSSSSAALADQLLFCVSDAPQQTGYKEIIVIGAMGSADGDGGYAYRTYRTYESNGNGWLRGALATMTDVKQNGVARLFPWSYQNWPTNRPDGTAIFRLDLGLYKFPSKGKIYLNENFSIDNFVGTFTVFEYENRDSETVRGIIVTNMNEAGGGNYIGETKYTGEKVYLSKMDSTAL